MDSPTPSVPFWDAVRAWADSAGFLLPQPEAGDGEPERPKVPPSVCENCPICQGAATLDQVNPEVISELAEVARTLIGGLGSALASAAEQRLSPGGSVPGAASASAAQDDADTDAQPGEPTSGPDDAAEPDAPGSAD